MHGKFKSQKGLHQRDVAVHGEVSAIAAEYRVLFTENVKHNVPGDALVTLLCHSFKPVRMPLWSARFDDEFDRRLAVDQLGAATVGAGLLMNDAAAVAYRTQLRVRLRGIAADLAKGGV